jgi:hypothetical protein
MEHDLLERLLDGIELEHEDETSCIRPESPAHAAFPVLPSEPKLSSTSSTTTITTTPTVQAKQIRPELDPLPRAATEARSDYFTVKDYVWPAPTKRACRRMPDEERRQRHRESQREFMTRKRAQFRAMRAEIAHLERQIQWLEMRGKLKQLTQEHQSLQASLAKVVASIEAQVWNGTAMQE